MGFVVLITECHNSHNHSQSPLTIVDVVFISYTLHTGSGVLDAWSLTRTVLNKLVIPQSHDRTITQVCITYITYTLIIQIVV